MNLPEYTQAIRDAHSQFHESVALAHRIMVQETEWLNTQFTKLPDEDAVPSVFEATTPDPAEAEREHLEKGYEAVMNGEYAAPYEMYRRIRDAEKELFLLDGADVLALVRKLLPDVTVTEPGVARGIEDFLENPEAGVQRSRSGRHRKA